MDEKKEEKERDIPIAFELAKKQREIPISEFFSRNRHLLGFDNKRKALLTAVKEAVDNAIDAAEDARILPEVTVEIIDMNNDRFRVIVEDNGPGIVKEQVPKVFAKLLYGSKFFKLSQSRGQQGLGISAAALYGQLTTGRPIKITTRISPKYPAHYYELHINTQKNSPEIVQDKEIQWQKEHGTRVELDIEATYQKGPQSVDAYLKQTSIVNPHITIIYVNPKAEQIIFPRATDALPKQPKEIKPHPYGVELGKLIDMLKITEARTLQAFLTSEFSRVGPGTAKEICNKAGVLPNFKPKNTSREQAERIVKAISETKIISPPTDCIVPIGQELLERGLKKEIKAEFYCSTTRPPSVYRGNPFVVEAGIAYGGELAADQPIRLMRFANKVPLLFQQSGCAITQSVVHTNWRAYGMQQSQDSLPVGPAVVLIHIGSVWVPFTSESKEAIAHYPEIIKEIKLALQECGRKLYTYINKKRHVSDELQKRGYIEKYIPIVAEALVSLLELKKPAQAQIEISLKELLERKRGKLEKVEMENPEYDKEFASIGESNEQSD